MIERLRIDLPNFPEEILSCWLEPYAKSEGWPPANSTNQMPQGRWRYILRRRPLQFWQSLQWELVSIHLSLDSLTVEAKNIICQMVLGAYAGHQNDYSISITDMKPRINRITDFIANTGRLPRPPALLKQPDGFEILDGNHRLAAYFYCYGWFNLPIEKHLEATSDDFQEYWVASPKTVC